MAGLLATDEEERLAQLAAARRAGGFMDRAGQAVADGWNYFQSMPDRLRQQTIDYYTEKGLPPETVKSAADLVSSRASLTTGIADAMVPQTAEDVALTAALGPYKLLRKPAAGVAGLLFATDEAEAGKGKLVQGAQNVVQRVKNAVTRSTQLPNLRELPTDDAVKIARKEPHLIQSGDQSESFYVGGPRDVQSRSDLLRVRRAVDKEIAAEPRGHDWYDRYRAGVAEVTGNQPYDNKWMSNQGGQWSAGVDPGGELGFNIKETNASIAGMPTKAARPAQHEAHLRAIEANDPNLYQLGKKTGRYAGLINPDQALPAGATGVNDFRHARNFAYTEADGKAQRDALTAAQHTFLDYETALLVDRANKKAVGGYTDWSGERIQAAPWVRQKALDILEQRPALTQARMGQAQSMIDSGYGSNMGKVPKVEDLARDLAYEDAFALANRTIADYFPKHTLNATYEVIPGFNTGHLPGSINASNFEKNAYSFDPRSQWNTAPGNRDAIYGGLRSYSAAGEPTGNAMRVRPTLDMQGLYQPPNGGLLETNPGNVARPLVAFDNGPGGTKVLPAADRAIVDAAENFRAYLDAQDAGAAHKNWVGGRAKDSNSLFAPMDRAATKDELLAAREVGQKYGLGDAVDTGKGITLTDFENGAPVLNPKTAKQLVGDLAAVLPGASPAYRVKVDSIYAGYVDKWKEGAGSGAATRQLLEKLNVTPELRNAFDNNPYIPERALARLERDADWSKRWGVTRDDLQNARQIIGDGPGWVGRLEEALKKGAILPAIGGALYIAAANGGAPDAPL